MLPSRHVIASLSLGIVLWFFTKSIYASILCFVSGVLIDIDHFLDYIIHRGLRGITFRKVYKASKETGDQEGEDVFKKLYLILHSGEIVFILWALTLYTRNIYVLALSLGYTLHLIMDCIGNKLYPSAYFVLWRVIRKFEIEHFFKKK